eukprot:gene36365-47334_t
MPARVVGMLRIDVCDWEESFLAEEQEQVATDLLRFHGRDLKGTGCSVVGLGLCIVRRIEKLHQVRSVLCLDDEEDDNAAPMLIPHGSFDLMVLLMMQSRVIIREGGNRQPTRMSELRPSQNSDEVHHRGDVRTSRGVRNLAKL